MITRVAVPVHRLDAGRVIHVRHRRNRRSDHVELVDSEQVLLFLRHGNTMFVTQPGDEQHVRTVRVEIEPGRDVLPQHRRRERPKGFAELDLEVQQPLHRRGSRIAEDRPRAERARSELHPALVPADRQAGRQRPGTAIDEFRVVENFEPRSGRSESLTNRRSIVVRAEIRTIHSVTPGRCRTARPTVVHVIRAEGGTHCTASVTGRRLYPDLIEGPRLEQLAVCDAVQGYAAGEAEVALPAFLRDSSCQPEHDLLGDALDARCKVHVLLAETTLRTSRWPAEQRMEATVRHAQAGAVVEIVQVDPE